MSRLVFIYSSPVSTHARALPLNITGIGITSPTQKAALLEEIEDEGGKVAVVARRHGISESLLYNWRSAWKAAASEANAAESVAFVPLGVVGEAGVARRPLLAPPEADRSPTSQASAGEAGTIEIALPNGVRICVAGVVSEKALSRVMRATRSAL
jgi:transposase